jgi:hypothetical protein
VDLLRRLDDQEQAARDEDEVTRREREAGDCEQRRSHADDPGDRQQQHDAEHQRQHEADLAGAPGFLRFQLLADDGEEDHIVDAKYDFQCGKRDEAGPGGWIGQKFHSKRAPCKSGFSRT